ncbi:N-acetyl-anhydromuramyl-L-alanine amidase [gamma proteobacterium HdN1]|nr:N-acetyl-anhydromuramyl-L-alanine amidase [gamma proteobacterium HdN1]
MSTSPPTFAVQNGRLTSARQVSSPNFNARPEPHEISLLVIHCISLPPAQYSGDAIERFFMNQLDATEHPYFETIADLQVSAHLLIRRDGEVVQFVDFDQRAWHAGKSCFEGRENCNDYSIGIELEGTDTDEYTEHQYAALAAITKVLMQAHPKLTPARIAAHSTIAPERKTDPGPGFDWPRYLRLIVT